MTKKLLQERQVEALEDIAETLKQSHMTLVTIMNTLYRVYPYPYEPEGVPERPERPEPNTTITAKGAGRG